MKNYLIAGLVLLITIQTFYMVYRIAFVQGYDDCLVNSQY